MCILLARNREACTSIQNVYIKVIDQAGALAPRAFARLLMMLPRIRQLRPARPSSGVAVRFVEVFMAQGTVKWFNAQKGFGFIAPEDGGNDVFVHISAVERAGLNGLQDGQKIGYEMVNDRRTGRASADNLQAV